MSKGQPALALLLPKMGSFNKKAAACDDSDKPMDEIGQELMDALEKKDAKAFGRTMKHLIKFVNHDE